MEEKVKVGWQRGLSIWALSALCHSQSQAELQRMRTKPYRLVAMSYVYSQVDLFFHPHRWAGESPSSRVFHFLEAYEVLVSCRGGVESNDAHCGPMSLMNILDLS